MTIAIDLLCDKKQSVVLITDRETTQQPITGTGIYYQNQGLKYKKLNELSMAVFSGKTDNEILQSTDVQEILSIKEVTDILSKSYQKVLREKTENFILKPLGIESTQAFLNKPGMNGAVAIKILDQIQSYSMECEFLVGGCDNFGGHVYHVANRGSFYCYDEAGFRCLGIGAIIADSVFAFYRYSGQEIFEDALKIGIEAKRRSEIVLGVGKETDIWKIGKDGISEIKD